MKKVIISTVALLLSFVLTNAKSNQTHQQGLNTTEKNAIVGSKFYLKYQAFASHDKEGTNIDTVSNAGDYIFFSEDGIAYMYFKGKYDSIHYNFVDKNAISFGDTPFIIKDMGNGLISFYQNEEEKNGDYNRTTYLLKKDNDKVLSFSN